MRKKDFEGLIEGLGEAIAHSRGKHVPGIRVHVPINVDTKDIRTKLGMSQRVFAERHGLSVGAVRDWEQGRSCPEPAVRAFLKVIAEEPEVVARVLAA